MIISAKKSRGFTLIELLVVISIISLLSSVVLSSVNAARAKARDAKRKADISAIVSAMHLYASDNGGSFPAVSGTACLGVNTGSTCWGDRNMPGNSGLQSSLAPYITSLPKDPLPSRGWGDSYLYLDGSTPTGCTSGGTSGKYILWRPDDDSNPGALNCQGKGYLSCCGTGAPCNSPGGYYCAFKFD